MLVTSRRTANVASSRADGIQRIGKVCPTRHPVDARCGAESGNFGLPIGTGSLRAVNLVRAHPLKPVIARVEFAHMLKAEPAEIARPVEGIAARAWRTKLARLAAGRVLTLPPIAFKASVKPSIAHERL